MIPYGKKRTYLPTVLCRQEVEALLKCTHNRKHRTLLMVLYATGLRISEATNLQVSDIDSQRMLLKVTQGKGNKMRYVPFSPRLLEKPCAQILATFAPRRFSFQVRVPTGPWGRVRFKRLSRSRRAWPRSPSCHAPHFASFLRDGSVGAGVDLLTISRLLGHRGSDHSDLSPCASAPTGIGPQPAGLAARQPASHLAAAEQSAEQAQAKLAVASTLTHCGQLCGRAPTTSGAASAEYTGQAIAVPHRSTGCEEASVWTMSARGDRLQFVWRSPLSAVRGCQAKRLARRLRAIDTRRC